ncbi:MAG: hypothetical protein R3B48_14890 [Kofleriaceae bacterium]
MIEQPNPRWLLPTELVVLAACASAPLWWPLTVPIVLPLLIMASVSMAARRVSMSSSPAPGGVEATWIGAGCGALALIASVLLATPFLQYGLGLAVQWSAFPELRGSAAQAFAVAVLITALTAAQELVFRRWVIERAFQLGASGSGAITVAAVLEAVVGPGGLGARVGLAVGGFGLGLLYWRGGRRLGPALAARLAFSLGAVALQALRLVG